MLSRILEPEVMDTHEEALAYDAMDHSEVNRRFVDDVLAAFRERGGQSEPGRHSERGCHPERSEESPAAAPETLRCAQGDSRVEDGDATQPSGEWLDLGTGTALIPVELCERMPHVRVVALDLSLAMLDLARANVSVAHLTERIMLVNEDAKRLPYPVGQFAAVISNSIVHHIPEPAAVLAEAWRVLSVGGLMFVRDLLRPADDSTVKHLVDTYAAGATDHQRQMFDDSLRAALTLGEIRALVLALGADPASVRQTTDRHWTWSCWK